MDTRSALSGVFRQRLLAGTLIVLAGVAVVAFAVTHRHRVDAAAAGVVTVILIVGLLRSKDRALVLAGLRAQPLRAYVDDVLTAEGVA